MGKIVGCVGRSGFVGIDRSDNPSQDRNYLHISVFFRQLHRPSFVRYNVVGMVWMCGICCPFLYRYFLMQILLRTPVSDSALLIVLLDVPGIVIVS